MSSDLRTAVACSIVAVLASSGVAGCATPGPGAATTGPGAGPSGQAAAPDAPPPPRPADAEADAKYYRERADALATEAFEEIGRTDCRRLRRGRLYAGDGVPQALERSLSEELSAAFGGGRPSAVLDVTSKILAFDQTDIRAHMLRAIALRKVDRSAEADFHRALAIALIQSIVSRGDGKDADSAWTVYQVKEEYEVVKTLGGLVESQSLASEGGRMLDVLEARRVEGGKPFQIYFDVTELFAERERSMARR